MHAIRLIGQNHTTHHEGEVISIADERTAMTNRNTVTLEHAHTLVERGEAEWVGAPPHDEPDEKLPSKHPDDEELERLLAEEEAEKEHGDRE